MWKFMMLASFKIFIIKKDIIANIKFKKREISSFHIALPLHAAHIWKEIKFEMAGRYDIIISLPCHSHGNYILLLWSN